MDPILATLKCYFEVTRNSGINNGDELNDILAESICTFLYLTNFKTLDYQQTCVYA